MNVELKCMKIFNRKRINSINFVRVRDINMVLLQSGIKKTKILGSERSNP